MAIAAAALSLPLQAQQPLTPPAGLVSWWTMDGSGKDIGPAALSGVLAGPGGLFPAGAVLQAFAPMAPNGHLAVPDAPELDLVSNFTWEGWVRIDGLNPGPTYLLNKGSSLLLTSPYVLGVIGTSGTLTVTPGTSIGGLTGPGRLFISISDNFRERVLVANTPMPMGTFCHVAVTSGLSGVAYQNRLYLNGFEVSFGWVATLPFNSTNELRLGGAMDGGALNGALDEFTLYSRHLSAVEISSIYAAGVAGKLKPNLDTDPPVITIEVPREGAVFGKFGMLVQALVSDESATRVESLPVGVDVNLPAGGGLATGDVPLSGTDGELVLVVMATDSVGNTGMASVGITLDSTPPVVSVVSPRANSVLATSPASVALSVSDATATVVEVGGQSIALLGGQHTVAFNVLLLEGVNTVRFTVTDAGSNQTVVEHRMLLDLSAPIVAITDPADGALFAGDQRSVLVTARVDDVAPTTVSSSPIGLSASLPEGGGLAVGMIGLAEGLNTISVQATDTLGMTSQSVITVNLDSTAPAVTFVSPAGGAVSGVVEVRVSAADIAPGSGVTSIQLFAGTSLLATSPGADLVFLLNTTTLAEGALALRAVTVDGAGNFGSAVVDLVVDNTAPVVNVLSPMPNDVVAGTVAFSATATDVGSGLVTVVQRVAGRSPTADGSTTYNPPAASVQVDSSEDTTLLPNGMVTFEIEAIDAAGNSTRVVVDVDVQNATNPEQPWSGRLRPRDGARVHGEMRVRMRSEEEGVVSCELLVDGKMVAQGSDDKLRVEIDTTEMPDGPLLIRAVVHTESGSSSVEHTVFVNNVRVKEMQPQALHLDTLNNGSVRVELHGPAAALQKMSVLPIEIRVPGGGMLKATGVQVLNKHDDDDHDEAVLLVNFDRDRLVGALRAALATGHIDTSAHKVWVQVRVGGAVVDRARLVITGRQRR